MRRDELARFCGWTAMSRVLESDVDFCQGFKHDWQRFTPLDGEDIFEMGWSEWWECTCCHSQKEEVFDGLGYVHHRNYYYSEEYKNRDKMSRPQARVAWAKRNGRVPSKAKLKRAA